MEYPENDVSIQTFRVLSKPSTLMYLEMPFFTIWAGCSIIVLFVTTMIGFLSYGIVAVVFLYGLFRILNILDSKVFTNLIVNLKLAPSDNSRFKKVKTFESISPTTINIRNIKNHGEK